jgi:hypothetical protein
MAQEGGDMAPANQVYYLDIGVGDWSGRFTFEITDWSAFRRADLGLVDRLLTLWLVGALRMVGWGAITSTLARLDHPGSQVRVRNHVRVHRFGVGLYVLEETYTLSEDGSGVAVDAHERFGPVPFLFRRHKRHTAMVLDDGMRAVYALPLLGAQWTAVYRVGPDRRHIDSTLRSAWAEAHERISKRTA